MINSVVLVLREILEAAILVTALMGLARIVGLGLTWFYAAAAASLVGVIGLAAVLGPVTDMLDGTGQEVIGAALQYGVYLLVLLVILDTRQRVCGRRHSRFTGWLMAAAVALAVTREGAEIQLYIGGFMSVVEYRQAVLLGSALGAGIGISAGILFYWTLVTRPRRWAYPLCLFCLCLLATGMIMQGTLLLEQAGWVQAGEPVWNSSGIVSEQSIAGELLYAVFGYEATPGPLLIALYGLGLALSLMASIYAIRSRAGGGDD
nr:FTR1 family protein [Parahaliea mediterranea]